MSYYFFDTNILVYLFDQSSLTKKQTAQNLLAKYSLEGGIAISTQVLQEFFVVTTRKLASPLTIPNARHVLEKFLQLQVILINGEMILSATRLLEKYSISFWDALIIEAAKVSGAKFLLTEDLQHELEIEKITLINPFT